MIYTIAIEKEGFINYSQQYHIYEIENILYYAASPNQLHFALEAE